ncbi:hypothetical protein E5676_scaffold1836G00140 [Cucumis melo var. makuwa]|uniref:Uncharacterized protein n=1 Tax=Cucumis melo var. makuwa TaxID=1194695 RepID=A0A5D3D7I7_CUCMM|nr:hypothetical protein E5676_scaffold1836G00140 [Cucumis melo var. makuwa]
MRSRSFGVPGERMLHIFRNVPATVKVEESWRATEKDPGHAIWGLSFAFVSMFQCFNQYVLGAPSGRRRPDFVPTGAHVARVWERASYWAKVKVEESWRVTEKDP